MKNKLIVLKGLVVGIVLCISTMALAQPNWTVNAANYSQTMNITGIVRFDGAVSADTSDRVAARINGQIRGVAKPTFIESQGKHVAFLRVYSNEPSGDKMEILLYDASIDSIYMGANKQDFLANTSLGAINSPAILGTNNFPSAINLQQMNSSENQVIGSLFGFFLAEDLDAGQLHTFDLVTGEGDDENTKVSVDGNELKVAGLLNHEDSMPYRIRVRTEDNKGGFHEQVIELNVSDINDQPIIADGAFSVAENRPLGTIIEIVNFSDEDTGQNVKFNILSGDPKGVFEVETNTGNILVKDPRYLDFEEMSSFELEIQAKDDGSPSASAIGYYTVTIIDEEELNVVAPKYFSPNADGINDFWEVEDVFIYKDYTLKIYNSNQQQVYSKKEYDNLWNGMFGGNDLPAGTYYYVFSNQQSLPIHTGSITLIR